MVALDEVRTRWLVDPGRARAVAQAYCDARCSSEHPLVRAAYAQLGAQAEQWFARLTGDTVEGAVRVVFTRSPQAYSDASELRESVVVHRVLEVTPCRLERERRHPLLDDAIGGTFDQFRAVHDIVSHAWLGHDFSRDGEFSAWLAETAGYHGLARWALATELHAHHSVLWTTGERARYKAVLLDPALLAESRRAGVQPCW